MWDQMTNELTRYAQYGGLQVICGPTSGQNRDKPAPIPLSDQCPYCVSFARYAAIACLSAAKDGLIVPASVRSP